MAYTTAHITALKSAIATGAREVYYGDKRVVYRSLAEMKQILGEMETEVAPNTYRVPRRRYASQSKGLL